MKTKNTTATIMVAGALTAAGVMTAEANGPQALIDTGLTTAEVPGIDPGSQEFRQRAGIPVHETSTSVMPAPGPKGGMAKEPIVTSHQALWEIYGGLFYYTEEYDQELIFTRGGDSTNEVSRIAVAQFPALTLRFDTEIEVFGGHVGVERCLAPEWRIGLAVAYSEADTDLALVGFAAPFSANIDTDTLSVMPYLKFYREDAFGSTDWWANFLYGYTDQDFDISAFGATASTDGSAHTLKLNTGINFESGSWVHGPYAGFRYIDGEIDSLGATPSIDYESAVSVLGYQVSKHINLSSGVLVPQFRAAWEHEFEDGGSAAFGLPLAGNVEDIAVIGAGLGMYYGNGWNWVINYEAHLASEAEGHYVGFKVGKEF